MRYNFIVLIIVLLEVSNACAMNNDNFQDRGMQRSNSKSSERRSSSPDIKITCTRSKPISGFIGSDTKNEKLKIQLEGLQLKSRQNAQDKK
jgi:hypothetical protein